MRLMKRCEALLLLVLLLVIFVSGCLDSYEVFKVPKYSNDSNVNEYGCYLKCKAERSSSQSVESHNITCDDIRCYCTCEYRGI